MSAHLLAGLLVIPGSVLMLASLWLTITSRRGSERRTRSDGLAALSMLLICASEVLERAWLLAAWSAALMVLAAWLWWRGRRKRKDRAPRLAGYKARAALAALVAKLRESAQPRPVLRPVPGGAG